MNKIAVLDIETTGFFKNAGLILEVGIVELDLDTGKTKIIYNELVREEAFGQKHEDSWVFKNSDLTYKGMSDAQPLDIKKIQKIFDKYYVTAFNKAFDFEFLRDRGLKIEKELPCPMLVSTNIIKLPGMYGSYKWPKVQEAWDYFFGKSNGYIEEHRGADDAVHEAKIVYELYKMGKFEVPLGNPEVKEV